MFWDRVAAPYDLFEDIYNGKVYRGTGIAVAEEIEPGDVVLECACGTGAISKAGANFKRQFDRESYRAFFRDMGYEDVSYRVIEGRMPCMIAVIRKSFS